MLEMTEWPGAAHPGLHSLLCASTRTSRHLQGTLLPSLTLLRVEPSPALRALPLILQLASDVAVCLVPPHCWDTRPTCCCCTTDSRAPEPVPSRHFTVGTCCTPSSPFSLFSPLPVFQPDGAPLLFQQRLVSKISDTLSTLQSTALCKSFCFVSEELGVLRPIAAAGEASEEERGKEVREEEADHNLPPPPDQTKHTKTTTNSSLSAFSRISPDQRFFSTKTHHLSIKVICTSPPAPNSNRTKVLFLAHCRPSFPQSHFLPSTSKLNFKRHVDLLEIDNKTAADSLRLCETLSSVLTTAGSSISPLSATLISGFESQPVSHLISVPISLRS